MSIVGCLILQRPGKCHLAILGVSYMAIAKTL